MAGRPKGDNDLTLKEKNDAHKKRRAELKENKKKRERLSKEKIAVRKSAKKTAQKRTAARTKPRKKDLIEAMNNNELRLGKKEADEKRVYKERYHAKRSGKKVMSAEEKNALFEEELKKREVDVEHRRQTRAMHKASEAELELARRELARRKLLPFIQKFNKTYDAGWVHEHMCNQLEKFTKRIENKEAPRLMMFLPPRTGKSEIASKNFPAWVLGKHPEWEIIASSYAVSLPIGFSRKVQATIVDKAYQQLFPKTKLHPKSQSAEAWMTTVEGGYVAAGVGGSITGKGAHCVSSYLTVQTRRGIISISEVKVNDEVLGYDHETNKPRWTKVKAVSAAKKAEFIEFNGVRCTPDHRVWTQNRGYIQAGELTEEDDLVTVQQMSGRVRTDDEGAQPQLTENCRPVQGKDVLFKGLRESPQQKTSMQMREREGRARQLLSSMLYKGAGRQEFEVTVQTVRYGVPKTRRGDKKSKKGWSGLLLAGMLQRLPRRKSYTSSGSEQRVPTLQNSHTDTPKTKVLWARLLHSLSEKSSISRWIQSVCRRMEYSKAEYCFAGQGMQALPNAKRVGSTSYRPRLDESRDGELDNAVPNMPYVISSQNGICTADLQSRVQGNGEDVVDIQTDTRNFFCEGVLVHNCFIIDDPVKDSNEADSDTQRQNVWDWWGSTAKTRLSPGGGVLVIMTRWHDDDLSGRMILQMKEQQEEFAELIQNTQHNISLAPTKVEKAELESELAGFREELSEIDNWEIISYPAIAVEDEYLDDGGLLVYSPEEERIPKLTKVRSTGEALHPSRYPIGRLRNMKRSMQPRHWSALYQQNPVPDEGIYFTKDMIRFTASLPQISDMYLFAAWDLAVGEKQQNDYSVGVVMGLDYMGQIHVIDMIRIKANIHKVAEAVVAQYKKYPTILEIGIEKGQLELSLMPQLNKLLKKEKLYPTFNHELRPISDKWVRARPLQGRMQMGTVLFPHNQTWTESAVAELLRFPGGIHDDIVDALAWGVRMMGGRKEPPSPTHKNTKSWKDRLNRTGNGARIGNTPMGA